MNLINKNVLITGGTGSFGVAMLKALLKKNQIREIRILSRDEKKQFDLRNQFNNKKIKFFIGDVRDANSLDAPFKNLDVVFHAAALKQVPSCEFHPLEAVKTNIIGTENVIKASNNNKVKKLICLSTDKAVYPINAMGCSKLMMEKICLSNAQTNNYTDICITRYGNVIGSRGSLVPQIIEQINKNEPITITNPKMTRFLMSLDEAIKLVLYAIEKGENGDIFVQKTKSTTIESIALALKEIFKSKNLIKIIGIRKGEKIHETLLTSTERFNAKETKKFFKINTKNQYNYNSYFKEGDVTNRSLKDYTSENADFFNKKELKQLLSNIEIT